MRERLIKLLEEADEYPAYQSYEGFADYLLNNGVVVLPCKVGDVVYEAVGKVGKKGHWEEDKYIVDEWEENIIRERKFNLILWEICWGKTVFLTREEAERALEGGAE